MSYGSFYNAPSPTTENSTPDCCTAIKEEITDYFLNCWYLATCHWALDADVNEGTGNCEGCCPDCTTFSCGGIFCLMLLGASVGAVCGCCIGWDIAAHTSISGSSSKAISVMTLSGLLGGMGTGPTCFNCTVFSCNAGMRITDRIIASCFFT